MSRILRRKFELNDFRSFLLCEERIFAFFDTNKFQSMEYLTLCSMSQIMQCEKTSGFP